ncbi:unnamed protein product, partial [Rotaria sp. Silwood2]
NIKLKKIRSAEYELLTSRTEVEQILETIYRFFFLTNFLCGIFSSNLINDE